MSPNFTAPSEAFPGWAQGMRVISRALCLLAAAVIGLSDLWAPLSVAIALLPGVHRLRHAWLGAWGTSLRPAVTWFIVTWFVTFLAQGIALTESPASGRPWTGHVTYLGSLCALAGAVSLLNARRPGADAWAILTMLLVGVLLIPWLEGSGLVRNVPPLARLRLESPWSIFYGLLAGCSVVNYAATGFGTTALWVGLGWATILVGLIRAAPPADLARVWSLWGLAVALAGTPTARVRSSEARQSSAGRLWIWFRDRWGLVWALRIQDRFNATASTAGWSLRLGWTGLRRPDGSPAPPEEVPAEAVRTLIALLGRFATRPRLEREAGPNQRADSSDGE